MKGTLSIHTSKKTILPVIAGLFLFGGFESTPARSESPPAEINPTAFVYILNVGIEGIKLHYNGLRNGFAVGDGQYILTAAHCVADIETTHEVLCQPLVISPYYGDIFEAEIVAIDDVNDIAVLRPTWNTHPALELETSNHWKSSKAISITGYPPIDIEKGGDGKHNSRDIKNERVTLVNSNGQANHTITVGPVQYAAEGWSGSAFIVPETGKVAGITCLKHSKQKSLKIKVFHTFKIPLSGENRYISGCDPDSINALFETHRLPYGTPKTSLPERDRRQQFEHILSTLDTIKPDNKKEIEASLKNLCAELPDSPVAHTLAGPAFAHPDDMFSYEKAIEIAPDSRFVHAAYGNYLLAQNKPEKAVEQFQIVTEREPNHIFACHGLLSALVKTDPNAAEVLGQELTQRWPDNAGLCFEYAKALRAKNKYKEELPVVQKAIELCKEGEAPYLYQRHLADSLKANKHYEQAEQAYQKLLEIHECDRCWWAYTTLLLDMGADKIEQAQKARDKTMTFLHDPNAVAEKQGVYEAALERMLSDPNTLTPIPR